MTEIMSSWVKLGRRPHHCEHRVVAGEFQQFPDHRAVGRAFLSHRQVGDRRVRARRDRLDAEGAKAIHDAGRAAALPKFERRRQIS